MSGFATIDEAIEEIQRGRILVVVDDEDRENEGDLVMAAEGAAQPQRALEIDNPTWAQRAEGRPGKRLGADLERQPIESALHHGEADAVHSDTGA